MNKIALFSTLLLCQLGMSQNKVEIYQDEYSRHFYENLDTKLKQYEVSDLEKSKSNYLRIWRSNELFDLGKKPMYVAYYKNLTTDKVYKFEHKITDVSLNEITIDKIKNLKNNYGIGAKRVNIELVENGNYFTRVFFINNEINNHLKRLKKEEVLAKQNQFIKKLPSGKYTSSLDVNQPITVFSEKSEFYLILETELSLKQIDITNPIKQPILILNGESVFFSDINKLKTEDIKFYKTFTSTESGTNYGAVFIKTI